MELGTEVHLILMEVKRRFSAQKAKKYISENMGWASIRNLATGVWISEAQMQFFVKKTSK
jgi:hypothetical protein